LLVQYAGDYREVYRRLHETGTEIYYAHRYVLEQLGRIGEAFGEAGILCCKSPERYRVQLPSGVVLLGAQADPRREAQAIFRMIDEYDPTHLAILGPLPRIIRWGIANNRRLMCVCADSFETSLLRRFVRYGRLAPLLNHGGVDWIANHGINACLSLAGIGVERDKIVPWDFPHVRQPKDTPAKVALGPGVPSLLFVGALCVSKGISDLLAAVAELKGRGQRVTLAVAGSGELERFKALAVRLRVESDVQFLGDVPNHSVHGLMQAASIVVVPSRHSYPEGLPFTIYEALSARAPIVASDHPMFAGHLVHRKSAMVYRAGRPKELAARVAELLSDNALYATLSANAQEAWEGLQIPVKWGELLFHWAAGTTDDYRWIFENRLNSGRYVTQLHRAS
jgi:glycosyltransferase involved in cell wall biosynthesis